MFGRLTRLLGRWLGGGRGRGGRQGDSGRLGPRSEQLARAFLERAGFSIVATNYRCPPGELDIVARGEGKLVFVEVKARRISSPLPLGEGAGVRVESTPRPEAAVTRAKQKKIGRAAKYYCRARKFDQTPVRFDVIAIDWPDGGEPIIRHHPAAFRPDV